MTQDVLVQAAISYVLKRWYQIGNQNP